MEKGFCASSTLSDCCFSIRISASASFHTGLFNMKISTARIDPKLDRRIVSGNGAFSDLAKVFVQCMLPTQEKNRMTNIG